MERRGRTLFFHRDKKDKPVAIRGGSAQGWHPEDASRFGSGEAERETRTSDLDDVRCFAPRLTSLSDHIHQHRSSRPHVPTAEQQVAITASTSICERSRLLLS